MAVTRWSKIFFLHFVLVAITLVFLGLLFPEGLYYYSYGAYFVLYIFMAYNTFNLSKRCFLNESILPEGKAVFITGCGSGFGYHLALRLHSLGFHVFASCRNVAGEGAQELMRIASSNLQVLPLDVTSDESVQKALDFVKDNLGESELWALVNNAGAVKSSTLEFTSMEDFKDTMEVNTFGLVRVTKAFLPLLKKSRGRVVNVTSLSAKTPVSVLGAYSMSKCAATAYTQCLSQEMHLWGVRAISIEPETFHTPMASSMNMHRIIDGSIYKVSKHILEEYGEEFIEKLKKWMERMLTIIPFRKDCSVVIDDIVSALTQMYPSHVYRSRHNVLSRAIMHILENLPFEGQKNFMLLLQRSTDFPIPKSLKLKNN